MSLISTYRNALSPGAAVLWYRIERVLGQGAFGITYLATDDNLHRLVAIKEYLPGHLARREADSAIHPLTTVLAPEFATGLHRFLSEARTLARFEHPNIVRVHNVFELHNTAYMIMQYEDGEGLDRILNRTRRLGESALLAWLPGLLDGLETIHAEGYLHRDIKPANILIRGTGEPVLLDFGSARHATPGEVKTLTNFVSPGYAPIEQYAGKSDQQGPWTDIYGLGATLFRAMTGHAPPDAVGRSHALAEQQDDTFQSDTDPHRHEYSPAFVAAVDHALSFRIADRPQSIAQWRAEFAIDLSARVASPLEESAPPMVRDETTVPTLPSPTQRSAITRPAADSSAGRAGAAVSLGIIALIAVVSAARYSAPQKTVPLETVVRQPAPPAAEWPDTVATTPPSPARSGTPATQIAALLAAAKRDIEQSRLTRPPGRNAYEKYLAVLALAPNQAAAKAGIAGIAQRYIVLARRALEQGRLEQAEAFLARSADLQPGTAELLAARAELDIRRRDSTTASAIAVTAEPERSATAPSAARSVLEWLRGHSASARAPIEDHSRPVAE